MPRKHPPPPQFALVRCNMSSVHPVQMVSSDSEGEQVAMKACNGSRGNYAHPQVRFVAARCDHQAVTIQRASAHSEGGRGRNCMVQKSVKSGLEVLVPRPCFQGISAPTCGPRMRPECSSRILLDEGQSGLCSNSPSTAGGADACRWQHPRTGPNVGTLPWGVCKICGNDVSL